MITNPQQLKIIQRERRFKLFAVLSIVLLSVVVILAVPGLLTAFLLAFVISYLFKPTVNFLERQGFDRTLAILIVYLVMGAVVALSSTALVGRISYQAESLQRELPTYVDSLNRLIQNRDSKMNRLLTDYFKVDIGARTAELFQKSAQSLLAAAPNFISTFFSTLLLAPFFAFFMLRDGRSQIHWLLSLVPNNLFELGLNLTYQINQQLGAFIRARLLESIIVGGVVWIGLFVLSFPYAALFGIFAGLTNLIPYIGPIIGAAPAIVLSVVSQGTASETAIVGLVFLLAQIVDMVFIIPMVVAKVVDLHPVTVVIVIIVGSQILGILGMIISVPVASILKLTTTEIYSHLTGTRR